MIGKADLCHKYECSTILELCNYTRCSAIEAAWRDVEWVSRVYLEKSETGLAPHDSTKLENSLNASPTFTFYSRHRLAHNFLTCVNRNRLITIRRCNLHFRKPHQQRVNHRHQHQRQKRCESCPLRFQTKRFAGHTAKEPAKLASFQRHFFIGRFTGIAKADGKTSQKN